MTIRGFDFKPVDPKDIPDRLRGAGAPSRYLATIREFLISGAQAVRVEHGSNNSAGSVASCLRGQLRKAGLTRQVEVLVRAREVYLVRVRP